MFVHKLEKVALKLVALVDGHGEVPRGDGRLELPALDFELLFQDAGLGLEGGQLQRLLRTRAVLIGPLLPQPGNLFVQVVVLLRARAGADRSLLQVGALAGGRLRLGAQRRVLAFRTTQLGLVARARLGLAFGELLFDGGLQLLGAHGRVALRRWRRLGLDQQPEGALAQQRAQRLRPAHHAGAVEMLHLGGVNAERLAHRDCQRGRHA